MSSQIKRSHFEQLGYELRVLKDSDLDQIHKIEEEVYDDPWSKDLLGESLQAPMTYSLGWVSGGQCVAYSIYQVIFHEAHLLNIAVSKASQAKGLGSELLEAALADSEQRGALSFFLEVRPSNLKARKLYEAKGFKSLMEREKYYADGENALIMVLDLLARKAD